MEGGTGVRNKEPIFRGIEETDRRIARVRSNGGKLAKGAPRAIDDAIWVYKDVTDICGSSAGDLGGPTGGPFLAGAIRAEE